MNHNGVISLPNKPTQTLKAGNVVEVNSTGQALLCAAAANCIGVVLHDVKDPDSVAPVAIQLFSAGGIVNINATGTDAAGSSCKLVNAGTFTKGGAVAGTPQVVLLEKPANNGDMVQAIVQV